MKYLSFSKGMKGNKPPEYERIKNKEPLYSIHDK